MQNRQLTNLDLPAPDWVELVREEVAKGRSIAAVAAEIGMPRPSLSMLLSGTYPAKLDKVSRKYAARVFSIYRAERLCPHIGRGISLATCRENALAPMSTSNPEKLRQWRACRVCEFNPLKEVT
ncbi:hypothetical protein [Acidimangrovimonas sediminis]|uniref:hypothetical protein n=1 Tax=Acidimangrovimonas sediminis TaxID=2056283 RepID=UPI001E2E67A5|nr:hypothetical protein [Acidimangrovimonas sediminis]